MEEIFEKISQKAITKEDLVFLLEQLSVIEKEIFTNPKNLLSEKLKGKIDESLRKEIEKLEKEGILPSTPQDQISFFKEFENFLFKIPTVKLEIAFEPSNDFLVELDKWFKEKVKRKMILDIEINPKIIGGVKIEYQGRWRDYSLEKEMEKFYGGI